MAKVAALDFLYVDTNRVARILAQLGDRGLATQHSSELLEQSEAGSELSIYIAKLSAGGKTEARSVATYDPSWRLPVEFAQLSDKLGFIDLASGRCGDIVRATGQLKLRDYEFLRQLPPDETAPVDVTSPPHLIHASIIEGSRTTWSTLNSACTTASTGDLVMKFGTNIPGEWTLIGVLDHNQGSQQPAGDSEMSEFDRLAELARKRFGRPEEALSITPLLIYRELGQKSVSSG